MNVLRTVERQLFSLARRLLDRPLAPYTRRHNAARTTRAHADERTIRRAGEAELGGVSSEESRKAYDRGENPGGLHHGGKGPMSPRRGGDE